MTKLKTPWYDFLLINHHYLLKIFEKLMDLIFASQLFKRYIFMEKVGSCFNRMIKRLIKTHNSINLGFKP